MLGPQGIAIITVQFLLRSLRWGQRRHIIAICAALEHAMNDGFFAIVAPHFTTILLQAPLQVKGCQCLLIM